MKSLDEQSAIILIYEIPSHMAQKNFNW